MTVGDLLLLLCTFKFQYNSLSVRDGDSARTKATSYSHIGSLQFLNINNGSQHSQQLLLPYKQTQISQLVNHNFIVAIIQIWSPPSKALDLCRNAPVCELLLQPCDSLIRLPCTNLNNSEGGNVCAEQA